jgi:cellulose biosynthesis protein BcsQ
MRTICLLARKWGTGKTTLRLHLAVLASEPGRNASIVDIAPPGRLPDSRMRTNAERFHT